MKRKVHKVKTLNKLTSLECEKLFAAGEKAMEYTYPEKRTGFSVALLTKSGNIYTGASYGSDTATLTMHSEASALTHAANHGETDIVAITGPNCHICKQLIWESSLRSKIDTLIVFKEKGKIKQIPISKLMPYPWPDEKGNK
jgi:cytidine deaminase